MTKRTRYRISCLAGVLLAFLAVLSVFKDTQSIGVAAITAMMTVLSTYIWGETKRPSNKEDQK